MKTILAILITCLPLCAATTYPMLSDVANRTVTGGASNIVLLTTTQTISGAKSLTNTGNVFVGSDAVFYSSGTTAKPLQVIGGVQTNSNPVTISATYNAAGVSFDGLKIDITNTAAASGSRGFDYRVAGASYFKLRSDAKQLVLDDYITVDYQFGNLVVSGPIYASSVHPINYLEVGNSSDSYLRRSSAGVLALTGSSATDYRDLVARTINSTNAAITNIYSQTVQILQRTATNNPSTVTDAAFLFAKDVAGTAEMFVMDEGGTATQISPHSRTSPGKAVDTGLALPIVIHHRNEFVGTEEWIHLSAMARKLEQLTGEKFVFSRAMPAKDWTADQQAKQAAYDAARFNERQALLAWQALPDAKRTNSIAPVVRPARDIRKPNPFN